MIKKATIMILLIAAGLFRHAQADEGMWLPFLIPDMLQDQMKEMGLELTPEEIFSLSQPSVKDAIVSFGGGCTAEIISPEGLLLTNHHCGYGRIQQLSTTENDYLRDGFWAMSKAEELPSPGLFVSFLVDFKDVTAQVNATLKDEMSMEERNNAITQITAQIVKEATDGTHYLANVRPKFSGNEFYLFVYERFTDVRLVGTPPSSIGKYGGDTDNWMWPRHTGDFALFRVYTGPDGKPANYHPDNIPLKPKHYLPVSIKGVKENDFAMVLGFPGSTDRYLPSFGIDYRVENEFPVRIDIRRKKLDVIEAAMASSDELRIKYASRQSGISNYWKNFIGMKTALQKHKVADLKRVQEEEFIEWVSKKRSRRKEYGDIYQMYQTAYDGYRSLESFPYIHIEAIITGADIVNIARNFRELSNLLGQNASAEAIEKETQRISGQLDRLYRVYDAGVDADLLTAMLQMYYQLVPGNLQPQIFTEINRLYPNDFEGFVQMVYQTSPFASREKTEEFLKNPSPEQLKVDWALRLAIDLYDKAEEVNKQKMAFDESLANARRMFVKGLREMDPKGLYYPDANSTMRFTYGTVNGYHPADGVYYDHVTTIKGVMEKEDPNHHEFVVPEKLKELYKNADYGRYGEDGTLIVNFISNNDITGGNSGSPVLDGAGNLIGLAFDGNWEAMSGDILFENQLQRTISVDARYILFVIDKFAGAGYLIDEMTIVDKNTP
jgi:hypothetical protein